MPIFKTINFLDSSRAFANNFLTVDKNLNDPFHQNTFTDFQAIDFS